MLGYLRPHVPAKLICSSKRTIVGLRVNSQQKIYKKEQLAFAVLINSFIIIEAPFEAIS